MQTEAAQQTFLICFGAQWGTVLSFMLSVACPCRPLVYLTQFFAALCGATMAGLTGFWCLDRLRDE